MRCFGITMIGHKRISCDNLITRAWSGWATFFPRCRKPYFNSRRLSQSLWRGSSSISRDLSNGYTSKHLRSVCSLAMYIYLWINDKRKRVFECSMWGEDWRTLSRTFTLFLSVPSVILLLLGVYLLSYGCLQDWKMIQPWTVRAIESFEIHKVHSFLNFNEIGFYSIFQRLHLTQMYVVAIDRDMISKASSLTVLRFVRTINVT